jgi:hypothetical protein
VWIATILVGFTSICGSALTLFLLKEEWRMFGEARRQVRELPPEVRRQKVRLASLTLVGMVIVAGLIFGAYELGAHAWSSRTGAVLAIAVFVLLMGCALTAMVLQSFRELSHSEPSGGSDSSSG